MFTERRKKWIQEKRSVCIIDKLWNLERLKAQIKDEEIGFIFACHKMWDSLENIPFLQKELLFQKWKSKNGEKLVVDSISKENFRSFKEILYFRQQLE